MTKVTGAAIMYFLPPLCALFCSKPRDVHSYPPPIVNQSPRHCKVIVTKSWHSLPDGKVPRWLLPITQLTEPVTLPSYKQTENRVEWKRKKLSSICDAQGGLKFSMTRRSVTATTAHCHATVAS